MLLLQALQVVEFALAVAAEQVEAGARQHPPVTLTDLPEAERRKWIDRLPDLAGEWVAANESKGLPARALLKAYMDGLRAHGEEPERQWDRGL